MIFNLILMLLWAALFDNFTPTNLFVGFGVGYGILALLSRFGVPSLATYVVRVVRVVKFGFFYLWELIVSNFRLAVDILTPGFRSRPAIVAVPLDELTDTDAEITLLANLITLTPGTLTVDISPDNRILYVHTMSVPGDDLELFRRQIKHDFERRVIEVLH